MKTTLLAAIVLTLMGQAAQAATPTLAEELAAINREEEHALYVIEDIDERTTQVDALLVRANDLYKRHPESALARAWVGWLYLDSVGSQTNPQSMLARLQVARTELQGAVDADPNCCGSAAYMALALIHQFPTPGSKGPETARMYFQKALDMDPNGISVNARYGGFLMRAGEYDSALKHLNVALIAPSTSGRPAQDRSVREQAQATVDQINERKKK